MEITIRLLGSYRRSLPQAFQRRGEYPLLVPDGARVQEVLAALPIPEADLYTFFVNGRHARPDQVLDPGDVLALFPAIGGG
jgi:molybdopterin converting factor small subunit